MRYGERHRRAAVHGICHIPTYSDLHDKDRPSPAGHQDGGTHEVQYTTTTYGAEARIRYLATIWYRDRMPYLIISSEPPLGCTCIHASVGLIRPTLKCLTLSIVIEMLHSVSIAECLCLSPEYASDSQSQPY